jgi:hypothetical protein
VTDAERLERALWKLEQAGYRVTRPETGARALWYIVWRGDTEISSMDNLAALAELADAIYADHWTGRKITPSA